MPGHRPLRRLPLWWLAVNSLGVALAIAVVEYSFFQGVREGSFRLPPHARHGPYVVAWLLFMIALGALQVLAGSWLISRVRTRRRVLNVALGVIVGITTALGTCLLGVLVVASGVPFPGYFGDFHYGAEALVGAYPFLLSGMVFGALTGSRQSRSLLPH